MTEPLGSVPYRQFQLKARSDGVRLITGPFITRLQTGLPEVTENIARLYSAHHVDMDDGFADFHLKLIQPNSIRRWYRPQVNFSFDGLTPFKPLPLQQAYAIFEWGLNWCISNYANTFLAIHSAVVEKNGRAIILPGIPGAGKSTLCAALTLSGWRLFSDEMALIEPATGQLVSNPRPISLKNESIQIIRNFSSEAIFGRTISDTTKGTVAHLKPPATSVLRSAEKATPSLIIFPSFRKDAKTSLTPVTRSRAFMTLCDNAFNYSVLGKSGFDRVKSLIDNCECYQFEYSNLTQAIELFDRLIETDNRESLKQAGR